MYRLPRRFKLILAGIGVLALVAAGGAIAKAKTSGSPHYRLATASTGTVEQDLAEVGTVSAVNRVTVSFPVSGTVGSVPVSVGMPVAAGAVLASLTTGALDQQVASATSTLASAQQSLAVDEASETESTASLSSVQLGEGTDAQSAVPLAIGSPTPRPTGSRSGGGGSSGGGSAGSSVQRLAAAVTNDQQKLLLAQQKLDQDLMAAEDALDSCLAALGNGGPTGGPTPSSSAPSSSAPAPSSSAPTSSVPTTSAPTSGSTGSAQCLAAIAQAPTKADTTADQQARDAAIKQLDAAIQALVTAAGRGGSNGAKTSGGSTGHSGSSTGSGTGTRGGQSAGSGGFTGTGGGTSSRTASGPASAQQLAADQAEIDAAQAELAVARQNRSAAVLTSPIAGTVAAVSITAGRAVSAGSTSSTITVIGAGQEQVSTTVSLTDLDSVRVGDRATVTVDGVSQPLTGVVSLIGVLNTSSGSTPTYPVTIVLDPTGQKLFDGSGASVQIEVASVTGVLTVPSSAVHRLGQLNTVTVYDHGRLVPTRIAIGAVGSDRTQVTSGLKAGQQVVLADLSEPLPTGA